MSIGKPPPGDSTAGQAGLLRSRQRLARFIALILKNGEEASFWAEHCGWDAGTGRCRLSATPECRTRCLFALIRSPGTAELQLGAGGAVTTDP
jgi:hypothetical protein